jgi:hypothetical protein
MLYGHITLRGSPHTRLAPQGDGFDVYRKNYAFFGQYLSRR